MCLAMARTEWKLALGCSLLTKLGAGRARLVNSLLDFDERTTTDIDDEDPGGEGEDDDDDEDPPEEVEEGAAGGA